MSSPTPAKRHIEYLQTQIIPNFKAIVDKNIYSTIINRNHQIEIATNKSAQSVGLEDWEALKGLSFTNYDNKDLMHQIFKEAYSSLLQQEIDQYVRKLVILQQLVFEKCTVIQFIDMLPYNNQFITYISTYTPILHPDGEVIAIQTFSIESYILRFQGHISSPNKMEQTELEQEFTRRELEILFLLSNGATQDQIAQILNITRGTIAAIISNQLCPKFDIAGANTKLLMNAAIKAGMYKHMPPSLWRPCLIILNQELTDFFIEVETGTGII